MFSPYLIRIAKVPLFEDSSILKSDYVKLISYSDLFPLCIELYFPNSSDKSQN